MRIEQRVWTEGAWGEPRSAAASPGGNARLVLVFGDTAAVAAEAAVDALRAFYPDALLFGCSTAGEIVGTEVHSGTLAATAIEFTKAQIASASVTLRDCAGSSFTAGEKVAAMLPLALAGEDGEPAEPLKHVLVLSDGLNVNGSDLVRGFAACLPAAVSVTGGLAGDGERFSETRVLLGTRCESGFVAALGFYGEGLAVGFGSLGGWDPFGPERLITRSKGNVLHEFDGQSALGLYKRYLGDHAQRLPASGLLFPLSIRTKTGDVAVVRTILAVDEAAQTLTFAGDVPEGSFARLMKANFDRLIDGASDAARASYCAGGDIRPELAVLISCVGRKLVLKQRVEEEVEGVREVLGETVCLSGFYSYGEISPFVRGARCELHNQTMSITTFAET